MRAQGHHPIAVFYRNSVGGARVLEAETRVVGKRQGTERWEVLEHLGEVQHRAHIEVVCREVERVEPAVLGEHKVGQVLEPGRADAVVRERERGEARALRECD